MMALTGGFYGSIAPNIARLDLTLKTVPVEKPPEIKTDLELPVGDYWWNLVTNSNPIFAYRLNITNRY